MRFLTKAVSFLCRGKILRGSTAVECRMAGKGTSPCTQMRTCSSELSVRQSTIDDYEAIMDLGRHLFDGMDYLPYTYHALTADPSWTGFVMENDKQVVAYYGHHLVSGGRAVMSRAGRVAAHAQKRGLITLLEQTVTSRSHGLYPGIEYALGTIKSTSPILDYAPPAFTRGVVAYRDQAKSAAKKNVITPPKPSSFDPVREVTPSEISTLFSNAANRDRLFPDGFISVRWSYFDATCENVDFIRRFSQEKYMTYDSNGDVRLLTLAVHFPCPAGFAYHVECYGDTARATLTPHLNEHLRNARAAARIDAELYFYVYESTDGFTLDTWVDGEMEKSGLRRYPLDYDFYAALRRKIVDVYSPQQIDKRLNAIKFLNS